MTVEADQTQGVDPGLLTLILTLRSHGISAEVEPIRQRCGWGAIGITEMLRCASDFGLKARTVCGHMGAAREHANARHRCAA